MIYFSFDYVVLWKRGDNMSYSEVLKEAIKESKLSHIQISEKCKSLGETIVPSYISKLVNGEMPPPSEKKTKVLAEALGIDSKKLTLEAYLDKAPSEIVDFLNYARFSMFSVFTMTYENNSIPADVYSGMKEAIMSLPLSDFMLEMHSLVQESNTEQDKGVLITKFNFEKDKYDINISESIGFPVKDDSMFPLLPKDSLVKLEIKEKYVDGDVLCFVNRSEPNNYLYRKCFFKDDLVLAHPLNSGYESLSLKINDITILGKVIRVIKDI